MTAKKMIGFVIGAVIAVAVGLAVLNRAKRQIPQIGKILGE